MSLFRSGRGWWCLSVLLLCGCFEANAAAVRENEVYERYVVAASVRAAREADCLKLFNQSAPEEDGSNSDEVAQEAQRIAMEGQDCEYLDAFYAELHYAAVHAVLGEGAWNSCLHLAPVGTVSTAPELGTYLLCLRVIGQAPACEAVRGDRSEFTVTGAGATCARWLAAYDWSQTGEPHFTGGTYSLFARRDREADVPSKVTDAKTPVHSPPAQVPLRGTIRTGFFLNCCTSGMGYRMPFTYLHLRWAVTLRDEFGTGTARDIELDRAADASMVGQAATVRCRSLMQAPTGHYALGWFCQGASIHMARTQR